MVKVHQINDIYNIVFVSFAQNSTASNTFLSSIVILKNFLYLCNRFCGM